MSPQIIVPPSDLTVTRHTPVRELQCMGNVRPLYGLELIWLKDGKPIGESGVPYSFNDLSGEDAYRWSYLDRLCHSPSDREAHLTNKDGS